jgi:predicted methyltransferase
MNRYKKAIAKENRPESDVLRDPNRKPDEVLRFLKVKEGDTVG